MEITLRPARTHDFDFCEALYFAGMENIIRELKLDRVDQVASFRQQWDLTQVRIHCLPAVPTSAGCRPRRAETPFFLRNYLWKPLFSGEASAPRSSIA